LPFAEERAVADQVQATLTLLALRDGKPDPVLLGALADKTPAKRAAAGIALARAGQSALPAVHKLLKDPKPQVRLRVGLALAQAKQKDAVPVLIALLEELPAGECGELEELLYTLADESAPDVYPDGSPESRKKFRIAWDGWFQKHKGDLDLGRLAEA